MPRGRPRKLRLSRMDAAVDAMVPFGFPVEKVKKHVKELLKVYGGDDGWPFIEEYSYKELIDAMLRDVEGNDDEEQVAEDDNQLKEKAIEDESTSGTSTRVSGSQQDEGHENNSLENIAGLSSGAIAEPKRLGFVSSSSGINNGDGKSWKDIEETANVVRQNEDNPKLHLPSNSVIPASPLLINHISPSLQPTNSRPPQRRTPCYGWIESDDDEDADDFVILKPAYKTALPREVSKVPSDGNKTRRKRRSRWDLRPDDP